MDLKRLREFYRTFCVKSKYQSIRISGKSLEGKVSFFIAFFVSFLFVQLYILVDTKRCSKDADFLRVFTVHFWKA